MFHVYLSDELAAKNLVSVSKKCHIGIPKNITTRFDRITVPLLRLLCTGKSCCKNLLLLAADLNLSGVLIFFLFYLLDIQEMAKRVRKPGIRIVQ